MVYFFDTGNCVIQPVFNTPYTDNPKWTIHRTESVSIMHNNRKFKTVIGNDADECDDEIIFDEFAQQPLKLFGVDRCGMNN
jgi:hypothetical protein